MPSHFSALFDAHELPASLVATPDDVVEPFLAWWVTRTEDGGLGDADFDFAQRVLELPLEPKVAAAARIRLLAELPKEWAWKVRMLLPAMTTPPPTLVEGLRNLLQQRAVTVRVAIAAWLVERDALQSPMDVAQLLLDRNPRIRDQAIRYLEDASNEELTQFAELLQQAALAERSAVRRRSLARLARKARPRAGHAMAAWEDPTGFARRVEVDWDAGAGQAGLRRALDELAGLPDSRGCIELLALQASVSSYSLREHCRALVEARLVKEGPRFDSGLLRALARAASSDGERAERKRWLETTQRYLEQAMIEGRPLPTQPLLRLLSVLSPQDSVVVTRAGGQQVLVASQGSPFVAGLDAVHLSHPAAMSEEELAVLRRELKCLGARPAFEQLDRAVYRVASRQESQFDYDLPLEAPRSPRALLGRGWERDPDCSEYLDDPRKVVSWGATKPLPGTSMTALWAFCGELGDFPDESSESISFRNQEGQPIELGKVPPVAFSELVRELTPGSKRSRKTTRGDGAREKPAAASSWRRPARQPRSALPATLDELSRLLEATASVPEARSDAVRVVASEGAPAEALLSALGHGQVRSAEAAEACSGLGRRDVEALVARLIQALDEILREHSPESRP